MEDVILKKFYKFNLVVIVSTVASLWAGWSGVQVPVAVRDFCSSKRPDWLWVSPSILSNGYRGHTLEEKRPGHKTDNSPQSR
jgi:hypothetical protein